MPQMRKDSVFTKTDLVAKPTILLVDDNPDNIKVLRGILRSDYRVIAALNGQKAIQIAQDGHNSAGYHDAGDRRLRSMPPIKG